MGLLGGLKNIAGGVVKTVTAPVTTAAKVVGTGLETGGKVLNELADGDVKGAAGAAVGGVKQQVGNVGGYFTRQIDGVKDVAGGTAEFVGGGAKLIGTPIKGAARIATAPIRTGAQLVGTGLETSGKVLGDVANGNFSGAASDVANGWQQQAGHVGDYFKSNWQGTKEIFGGPASVLAAGAGVVGGAAQGAWNTGTQVAGTVAGGVQDYANYQLNTYREGAEFLGQGVQTGMRAVGGGLETAGQGLQDAAG